MPSVTVNPPKTPVTAGSSGVAAATVPNVCKMPGPPAPFVPTPLPNIGKSGDSPDGYSTSVKIEGSAVAIQGASFKSMGDVASQGTGGGIVSNNVQGATKFVAPGSMDVKIEGKNVQYLGDQMSNNNGPSGSPPNAATLTGVLQAVGTVIAVPGDEPCPLCGETHGDETKLAESDSTNGACTATRAAFGARVAAWVAEDVAAAREHSTMVGVVECRCSKHFAEQSSLTYREFTESAAGCETQPGGECPTLSTRDKGGAARNEATRQALERFAGDDKKTFRKAWDAARERSKHPEAPVEEGAPVPVGYPPGACAAQKAITLALSKGKHRPKALTEKYYDSKGNSTAGAVEFRDEATMRVVVRTFADGATVPPCRTCSVIVPMLMCMLKGKKCG